MRNRTEMVTTTFYDSQDDDSDSDDSEEDWRPGSGRTKQGRKRSHSSSGGRSRKIKRKSESKPLRSNITAGDTSDDDYYSRSDGETHTKHNTIADYKTKINERNVPDRNGIFQLYVYKSDLKSDYKENMELCLWRWDGDLLIQKYIRLKSEPNEFIFTPSAVYSNWLSNRRTDFETIEVKCFEDNERKVYILKMDEFHKMAQEFAKSNDEPTHILPTNSHDEVEEEEEADDDEDDVEEIPTKEEIYDCDADDDDE